MRRGERRAGRRRLTALFLVAAAGLSEAGTPEAFRVCADPRNLPFSSDERMGFENRIAQILAAEMDLPLEYTWAPQRTGFVRTTLDAHVCDVIIGVPTRSDRVLTTRPYYCSSYVAVLNGARRDLNPHAPGSWDDARIGVVDGTPPLALMNRRTSLDSVAVYPRLYDYDAYTPGDIVADVAQGELDMALLWGPRAGHFVRSMAPPLEVVPLEGASPLRFAISLGVRHGDEAWRRRLEQALAATHAPIDAALAEYGVPRLPLSACGVTAHRDSSRNTPRFIKMEQPFGDLDTRGAVQLTSAARSAEAGLRSISDPLQVAARAPEQKDEKSRSEPVQETRSNRQGASDAGSSEPLYRAEDGALGSVAYKGWVRYTAFCERCHGPGGLGSGAGPDLTKRLEGKSLEHFKHVIKNGQKGNFGVMPAWSENPNVIPYIDNLWAYLNARMDGAIGPGRPAKLDDAANR